MPTLTNPKKYGKSANVKVSLTPEIKAQLIYDARKQDISVSARIKQIINAHYNVKE